VIDLFVYRGVPAVRAIGSGTLRADWLQAFGVSGWLRPFALSTSYLLTVWHATMVGILIAGLAVTVLPLYLKSLFSRTGIMGTLTGALYAIPQPFCSCCAAVIGSFLCATRGFNRVRLVIRRWVPNAEHHNNRSFVHSASITVRDNACAGGSDFPNGRDLLRVAFG
jgi:uncharacterized membrane protein YraQ (UPF0718 family)